jgi:ABC-type polysaccharide/polyol phosphate transport system ATPase subunit
MDYAVRAQGISKSFGKHSRDEDSTLFNNFLALDNITLDIVRGSFVGIIGPNGCGKSTFLRVIAGILKPSKGKIEITGRVASLISLGSGFHPELSGYDNIYLIGRILGFSTAEIKSNYQAIVDFSELESCIHQPVRSYSNGMFLRLAFSIYTQLDFDIYLFDEVLSVGDFDFTLKCKKRIEELLQHRKTIILASHNLSDLNSCTHFIELNGGKLMSMDKNSSILDKYINRVLESQGSINYTKSFLVTSFQDFNIQSQTLDLISIEVNQGCESKSDFMTSKSTFISFELINKNADVLDVILYLKDLSGEIVFISSDMFFKEPREQQLQGKYSFCCTIPADLLAPIDYILSAVIVKNTFVLNGRNSLQIIKNIDDQPLYGLVADLKDFARIRMKFSFVGFRDLQTLSLPTGKVLPNLKWNIELKDEDYE